MENGRIAIVNLAPGGMEGERSGHFGHCDVFTFVDVEAGEIKEVTTFPIKAMCREDVWFP
jgi:predicted Fe-Mo cluster-binding NifX family protein